MKQDNSARIFKQNLTFDCSLCAQPFDNDKKQPCIFCPKEHMYCLQCVNSIFNGQCVSRCPTCNLAIHRNQVKLLADSNRQSKPKKKKVQKSTEQLYQINGVPPQQPKPQKIGFFKRLKLAWFPPPPPAVAQGWVDPQCHDFKKMKFQANKVIVGHLWAHVFGSKVLSDMQSSFTIKAIRLQKSMWVGIVDRKYKKQDGPRVLLFNWIYYQNDTWCQDGIQSKQHGKGFKQGDTITVKLNRNNHTVQWVVNGEIAHTADCKRRLESKDVEWVPYVYMYSKDDCFQII